MVLKITLVFIFLVNLSNTKLIEDDLITKVLISLKQLEFEEAKEVIGKESKTSTKVGLLYLTELISLNTYREENLNLLKPLKSDEKTQSESLDLLIHGYESLFIYNNRVNALNDFTKGISIALKNQEVELAKALIIGIFIVKHAGYSLADNTRYSKYLEMFKNIMSDDVDRFWFHYYKIILFDMTIRYHEKIDNDQIAYYRSQLDSIQSNKNYVNDRLRFFVLKEMGDLALDFDKVKAFEYFLESELLLEPIPYFDVFRFRLKVDKARALYRIGDVEKAINTLVKNKDLIESGNRMTNQLNFNFFLSEFYAENNKPDSAFFHLKRLFNLELESNHNKINEKVSALEVELDTEKKEKQILIEKQRASTNRNWLIAAAMAFFLGLGIAFLLQKNTTKKRKLAEQQQLLEQQKVTTLLKEQELTSIDAMIAGQEKERTKVANELHDDLGSLMATVKLHFDNVKVDQKDPALMNAQKLLDEAYQKIRGMAHSKNSGVMANQGLLPAVKKMAKTINETNALEVTVEDFGLGDRMENSLELTIFRIMQELIANIIKHSEASKATIQFTQHEERLNIIVEDNGKGFDMSEVKRSASGMGLGTIEKRIEHLEGTFTVDSVLGKGTSILIDIPV